jgi:hypothetical protein
VRRDVTRGVRLSCEEGDVSSHIIWNRWGICSVANTESVRVGHAMQRDPIRATWTPAPLAMSLRWAGWGLGRLRGPSMSIETHRMPHKSF